MDTNRVNKIIIEETQETVRLLSLEGDEAEKAMEGMGVAGKLLADAPSDVRADARSIMEELVVAIDRWQRKEDRVVDGRACQIALELLTHQQWAIMTRVNDEGVGPRGPHKKT